MPGEERRPATEETIRTDPPWLAIQSRHACWISPRVATTLVSRIFLTAPRSASMSGPNTGLIPTFATSMSSLPRPSTAVRTAASWCSGSTTLPATAIA